MSETTSAALRTPPTEIPVVRERLAALGFIDTPRVGAQQFLEDAKAAGVKRFSMLTGDTQQTAGWVASNLGIADYKAGLLPDEKTAAIRFTACRTSGIGISCRSSTLRPADMKPVISARLIMRDARSVSRDATSADAPAVKILTASLKRPS